MQNAQFEVKKRTRKCNVGSKSYVQGDEKFKGLMPNLIKDRAHPTKIPACEKQSLSEKASTSQMYYAYIHIQYNYIM